MNGLITITELETRIGSEELHQIAGVGSFNSVEGRSLDEDRINQEKDFTRDLMFSFIAKRYPAIRQLDTADTPDLVKGYASDIVRYRLRSRTGNKNTVSDEVRQRYQDAMAWLKGVSRGLINVEIDGDENTGASVSPQGNVRAIIPLARATDILQGYRP